MRVESLGVRAQGVPERTEAGLCLVDETVMETEARSGCTRSVAFPSASAWPVHVWSEGQRGVGDGVGPSWAWDDWAMNAAKHTKRIASA